MIKNRIVNAGIRLTRKCNMKCTYCNIQNTIHGELTLEEWKKAIDIISELNVKEIVILGGEPTLYPNIIELVDYIVNKMKMICNLTTNAFENFEILKSLLNVGLNSLSVSIDNLEFKDSISPLKSKNGLELIRYLEDNNYHTNIINYTVLNKNNTNSIINLIKYMNDKGISTYILPFHWGNEEDFDHRKSNRKFAFISNEEIEKYNEIIDKIVELKKEGYNIKNSIEFLIQSKKYIKKLNWKCSGISELRIDSDGKLDCCCDKIGSVYDKFTIFNLKDNLDEFYSMRQVDASKCKGCLWPSSFEAELKK